MDAKIVGMDRLTHCTTADRDTYRTAYKKSSQPTFDPYMNTASGLKNSKFIVTAFLASLIIMRFVF